MSVAIRLRRKGTVKKAHWQVVATNTLSKRDGRYLEQLGYYDPGQDPAKVEFKTERLNYWLQNGAIPSQGVLNLMKQKGLKRPVRK
ncbi:MAG: 30S ribosomal protein S16 [Candidatus Omnitrophica bacterium]|nr:30S ribosomal protein S16 [Candidatus Omnitrophota bacterium]